MLDKYTNGVFISAPEDNGSTKLRKISLLIQGSESYRKFHIIRIEKTELKDTNGRQLYNLIKTVEYAYDGLLLVRRYCNYENMATPSSSFNKFSLGHYPEKQEFKIYYNNSSELSFNDENGVYSAKISFNYMYLRYRFSGSSHQSPALKLMFVPSV